jgi:hypothetical protein
MGFMEKFIRQKYRKCFQSNLVSERNSVYESSQQKE